ncbi:Alpha/Beta hydrolase fold containing protein [Parasponia andersonii]|uniref:Alpha/Beta hydrolase fold containing protein n=1 Tax=Parasponia andersonii TaxID=3476 RepID=A0A2P5E3N9_PARAD|nr:Alpha/Beta hydrolase fold containing protein [Parasponia andersonii]
MASTSKEVATEILPLIRVYKDGKVERLLNSPLVPPSPYHDPETGVSVSSKDISISHEPAISARLFLPIISDDDDLFLNDHNQIHVNKLPILVYYHGGGFCFESAFSADHHNFSYSSFILGFGRTRIKYREEFASFGLGVCVPFCLGWYRQPDDQSGGTGIAELGRNRMFKAAGQCG